MNLKIEYFKNYFFKENDNLYILNKDDSYVKNFGKQWKDYRNVQIDSINNFSISEDYLLDMCFQKKDLFDNKNVLEIGGGAGRFTEHLVKKSNFCVSVDLSSSVYHNVSRKSQNLIILKADFNKLISNKKFDIVFCRGVLQHTENPEKSLLNIHKFVKKNGLVIFDIYKMPKLGYLHPKYFLWRPLIKKFIKYENFEIFLKNNIKLLLKIKRISKKILFNSNFLSDSIIPIWDYKNQLNLTNEQLEDWAIMDTLDGLYAKYDFPQSNKKIIKLLRTNNIKIVNNNKIKNFFITKII